MPLAPHQRNQIIAGGIVLIFAGIGLALWTCVIPGLRKCEEVNTLAPVQLEFWNVYEDSDVYLPLIQRFTNKYPNVTITYHKKEFETYRRDLADAFTQGKAPDIFAIQNTWLPLEEKHIAPVSPSLLTFERFTAMFPDVARFDFTKQDLESAPQVYALPLYVDTLALFYNRPYFHNENFIAPPATWDDFVDYVKRLTKYNDAGDIDLAGAVMGTAVNINRSIDMLSMLMLQTGTRMTDETRTRATFAETLTEEGRQFESGLGAFEFYTSFANPQNEAYTWHSGMPYSIDAFLQGDAAMMFNYSYFIPILERKNRYLDFATALVPQPKDQREKITFANYWGLTVSKDSSEKDMAWRFILFLLEEDVAKQYLTKVQRPTSLKSLIPWQEENASERLKPFVGQVLQARSWYVGDAVSTEKILADAIEAAVLGDQESRAALSNAAMEVTTIFQKVRLGVIP